MARNIGYKNNTSGFNGVSWKEKNKKWQASIIGIFEDKLEAARAYNKAALKYFGEFANLNAIE